MREKKKKILPQNDESLDFVEKEAPIEEVPFPEDEFVPAIQVTTRRILFGLEAIAFCVILILFSYWFLTSKGILPLDWNTCEETSSLKQGLVLDDDNEIRYYVDGVPFSAGLVRDIHGDYYYIDGSTMTAIRDITRYISNTNKLLPEGERFHEKMDGVLFADDDFAGLQQKGENQNRDRCSGFRKRLG